LKKQIQYYNARVTHFEESRKKCWRLLYDDSEREWINLRKHHFYIIDDSGRDHNGGRSSDDDRGLNITNKSITLKEKSPVIASSSVESMDDSRDNQNGGCDDVVVGSRVSIWWGGDKEYFDGTVTQIDSDSMEFFVEYGTFIISEAVERVELETYIRASAS